jgi:6-phosphogluconolactonase
MRSRMMRREPEGQSAPRPADKALMARGGVLRRLRYTFLAAGTGLAAVSTLGGFTVPAQAASFPGAVYTMTNSPSGNAIEAFARGANGSLVPAGTYVTGGNGGTLGSGHSIVISSDGHTVIAVNAGSDSISEFAAAAGRLRRIATVASGGTDPNSVTMHGDLVYVLNAGSGSIAGFRLGRHGLSPIPGSRRPLGAAAQLPRQIQFSRDGRVLAVDEGGSSTIDTFLVARDGAAGAAITTPSVGGGPFGFDFDRAGHLLVSDAALVTGQSGATSYDVARNGTVTANGPAVPSGQAAACWLAAAGRYAYTGNAGSGSIGEYAVAPDGALTFRGSTLVENNPASHPLDEGVSSGQRYLYVLAGGLAQIVGYRVSNDGSLTQVTTVPVAAGAGGIGVS